MTARNDGALLCETALQEATEIPRNYARKFLNTMMTHAALQRCKEHQGESTIRSNGSIGDHSPGRGPSSATPKLDLATSQGREVSETHKAV